MTDEQRLDEPGPVESSEAEPIDPIIESIVEPGPVESAPLRDDGPSIEEFVEAGYPAEAYPPSGYAPRDAQSGTWHHKLPHETGQQRVERVRAIATDKGAANAK